MPAGYFQTVDMNNDGFPGDRVPPSPRQPAPRCDVARTLLFLLVAVALAGVAVEAFFIHRLYRHNTDVSTSQLVTDSDVKQSEYDVSPSKPVAHLTDGLDVVHGPQVMSWSTAADPVLFQMSYRDQSLVVERDGFYFVYSKVFFSDGGTFHHSVLLRTPRYLGNGITLLQSRKYSPRPSGQTSNSFLGGVFHLHGNDAVYVKVSNASNVLRHGLYENVFGAFMI